MVYFTTFVRPSLTRGTRGLVDLGLSRPKRSVDKHNRSKNILCDFWYIVSDTYFGVTLIILLMSVSHGTGP